MTLIGAWRRRRTDRLLKAYRSAYDHDEAEVAALQLAAFNAAWAESLEQSPWARSQRDRLDLPDRFGDWDEFAERVPIQRKASLRMDLAAVATPPPGVQWRSTGGSTAAPMRFPVFAVEAAETSLDIWLGRDRLGIHADDRLFMIWGHSHMFGAGLRGATARWRRRVSDMALGYRRWNAYQLSEANLAKAGDALIASRARYLVGYSTALDRFARANAGRAPLFAAMGLKAVIATAEGFARADSRMVIADTFGCPVIMEYGAVETGPIAYERPTGGYDVFWRHHRLELIGDTDRQGARELVVTSLNARAMPLLRYAIGDRAVPATGEALTGLAAIAGRCNDHVDLPDGTPIHSEAFSHAVRDLPGVRAYQIVRRRSTPLPVIRIEADHALAESDLAMLRGRLAKVHPQLADVGIERTDRVALSVAGKHQMVVEEP